MDPYDLQQSKRDFLHTLFEPAGCSTLGLGMEKVRFCLPANHAIVPRHILFAYLATAGPHQPPPKGEALKLIGGLRMIMLASNSKDFILQYRIDETLKAMWEISVLEKYTKIILAHEFEIVNFAFTKYILYPIVYFIIKKNSMKLSNRLICYCNNNNNNDGWKRTTYGTDHA